MRNYTGLAVWGCLFACLALEFIDFKGGGKADLGSKGDYLLKEVVPPGSLLPQAAGSTPSRRHSGDHGAPVEQAFAR